MDFNALWETLVAVAITPVVSIGMAMVVVAAIIFLAMRVAREESRRSTGNDTNGNTGPVA